MKRRGSRLSHRLVALALLTPFFHSAAADAHGLPQRNVTGRSRVLTLADAMQEGLAFDPRVGAEAEAVRQAEADVQTASQAPNPAVSLSKTLTPLGNAFTADRQGGPPQRDFELSYPLDWFLFGKRGTAVAAARLGLEEARATYEDFVRHRKTDIAVAFLDVLEAGALLDLARQDASDLDRLQAIAEKRVALGGAAAVEVDRIAVAVLEGRREMRRREAALRVARSTLAATIGREGADAEFDVEGDLAAGTPAATPDVATLLAAAEQARPDIRARRRAVEKAGAELRLARRNAWPELTSRAGYTRQYQESLGFADASSYGLALDLTVPMFDRNRGNIRKAVSLQSQRELELRAALLALRAEVEQAAAEYSVTREAVVAEDRAQLEAAQRVRERVQKAYELGGRPLLEVLDAQRIYRDAARQVSSGRAAFLRAAQRLNGAIGQEVVP